MSIENRVPHGPRRVASSPARLAHVRAAGAALVAIILSSPIARAQEIIIDFGTQTAPTATNVCETGDTKAAAWMSRAPVLGEVKRNVDLYLQGTSSTIDPAFYYNDATAAGKSRGQSNWRHAQTQIRSIKSELDKLARNGHTQWQPACEACNRYRTWWDLIDVAAKQKDDLAKRTTADGPKIQGADTLVTWQLTASSVDGVSTFTRTAVSSIDVSKLTQAQVEFQGGTATDGVVVYGVQLLLGWYNELATKRPTAAPSNPDTKICLQNMLPTDATTVPSVNQCRPEHYEQGMDFLVARLVKSLQHAGTALPRSFPMKQLLKDSNRLYDTSCPGDSYPNNWRLRAYE